MQVKIKKLTDNAVIPQYTKSGDAGMDLTATSISMTDNKDYGYIEYGTGLSVEIPEGYVGLLYPRSSISKTGLILANAVGVIDSGYRGEIKCRFKYIPKSTMYNIGERIVQLVIIPYPQIEFIEEEELTVTDRADGGFGHTGN